MTTLAMLVAAGILLQILENFIPLMMIIPGYKIGLANITGLFALYAYGWKDMIKVTVTRVILASLATGTLLSPAFLLSGLGAIFSLTVMSLCFTSRKFSIYGVSTAGAAAHTMGQMIGVCLIYRSFFMELLLPALTAFSVVSGLLIAAVTRQLLKRLMPREWKKACKQANAPV